MLFPEGLMHRKIHWAVALGVLAVLTLLASFALAARAQSGSSSGGGKANKLLSVVTGIPLTTRPYGGKILLTASCDTPLSCIDVTNPIFPVCLLVRCILQLPFVFQIFENYTTPPPTQDAYTAFRDYVAEPVELHYAFPFCVNLFPVAPYLFSSSFCADPDPVTCTCTAFQVGVFGLQRANLSPMGLAVTAMRQAIVSNFGSPGIALIFFPEPSPTGVPACKGSGYLLGTGYGDGVYITTGPPTHVAGDSCRGNYYPLSTLSSGGR